MISHDSLGLVILFLLVFLSQGLLQELWIRFMRALKIRQVAKEYGPEGHQIKAGTPSMGGVIFPLCVVPMYLLGYREALNLTALPALAAAVGFVDDYLKVIRRSGDGLSSLQKLFLQVALSLPWCLMVSRGGLNLMPGIPLSPALAVPLLIFLSVGIQNAVNVTDGLDGLAAGAVAISMLGFLPFLSRSIGMPFAVSLFGAALAFLWHNGHPARVFMGDGGAHFLAGGILALAVSTSCLLLVLPMGFLFGVEITSVAIQIVAIRRFGRRVFRMSPLHHHFELIGWPETRIVTRFWLVHVVGMGILISIIYWIF